MSAAIPLGADVAAALADRLGLEVFQGYGMTEMSPGSRMSACPDRARAGTCGVTLPNTECRIVDPETGPGMRPLEGELWVRGPQVTEGYHANPEATATALTPDRWLRTGDLGSFDAEGHLTLA